MAKPRRRRVIVTGGRDYRDESTMAAVLRELPAETVIVHGAARGADALAELIWATRWGRSTEPHPAAWSSPCRSSCRPGHRKRRRDGTDYCPAAGNYRNQEMADAGADRCLAFPGGAGTADMIARARVAGIPTGPALWQPELPLSWPVPAA